MGNITSAYSGDNKKPHEIIDINIKKSGIIDGKRCECKCETAEIHEEKMKKKEEMEKAVRRVKKIDDEKYKSATIISCGFLLSPL